MASSPPPGPVRAPDPDEFRTAISQAEAADQDRAGGGGKRGGRRSLWPLVVVLALAGSGVTVWNVRSLESEVAPLPPKRQRAELAGMLYVLTVQLEQVRGRTGSYPATLDVVAPPLQGVTYRREGDGYTLQATAGDVTLTHRSDEDPLLLAVLSGSAALGAGR